MSTAWKYHRMGGIIMEWTRWELKEAGRRAFRSNYWRSVIVTLLMMAICNGAICFPVSCAWTAYRLNHVTEKDSEALIQMLDAEDMSLIQEYEDGDDVSPELITAFVRFFWTAWTYYSAAVFLVWTLLKIGLFNPLEVGCQRFFLKNGNGKAELGEILYPLKNGYLNAVKTLFLRDLYIALWSMLFAVPGIVKLYSYRLIPYLLAENPRMATKEAFRISRDTMKGQKLNAFFLDLSFIGWNILAGVTCYLVGIFYAYPYQFSTYAALYQTLCGSASQFDIWITCTSGPLQGSAFPLTESQPVTIGRLPSNQICYPPDYPGISREHARVEWRNGVLTLTDCNSATGTYLDYGERLLPMQPREILPGNGFYLGSPENRFQIRN